MQDERGAYRASVARTVIAHFDKFCDGGEDIIGGAFTLAEAPGLISPEEFVALVRQCASEHLPLHADLLVERRLNGWEIRYRRMG